MVAGQFGNPFRETEPARTTLAILTVFMLPLGAPGLVYNLTHSRDSDGGWVLRAAPVERPFDLARGACKAVQVWVVTPLCIVLGIAAGFVWRDPVSAVLHAVLAWWLTWVFILASLWLVAPAWPFSLPPPRGAGLSVPPLPMLGLGSVLSALALVHGLAASYVVYWVALFALLPVASWLLGRRAADWLVRLGGPS
jgi:hypothetical protein